MAIVLDHAIGIGPQSGLAFGLLLQVGEDVHAGRVPPEEEGLVGLLCLLQVIEREGGDLLVDRLHPLLVQRPGAFDLLRAVRIGPAMDAHRESRTSCSSPDP